MGKNNGGGWIRLHRKIMTGKYWLSEPFTKAQAWVDLLLLANHRTGDICKRGIRFEVQRGQVGFSEETLAERWKWSRGKVRRFIQELISDNSVERVPAVPKTDISTVQQNGQKIVQQNKRLSYLISIINYDQYQLSGTTDGTTERTKSSTGTINHKNIQKKNPPDFSENEIPEMMNRYPDSGIIDQVLQEISKTRKTGKISDSVKLGILKSWTKYPTEQVLSGIRTYLDKGYAAQGKGEKYLLGIVRNLPAPQAAPTGPTIKRTGSLLDAYYKEQGFTLI